MPDVEISRNEQLVSMLVGFLEENPEFTEDVRSVGLTFGLESARIFKSVYDDETMWFASFD